MNLNKHFGNQDLTNQPDIFRKKHIKSVTVRYFDFWGNGNYTAEGSIEFKNGSTTAEQKFESETFDGVVKKIREAINRMQE